ncbi:MAG: hypothetical protein K8L99_02980 [Anaerolineae bacterium]|nr:hypothetical protein [Anaerolineae bacterium]
MNVATTGSAMPTHTAEKLDTERDAITHFIQMVGETAIPVDPVAFINLYVSLKSKPLAILTGTARSGKTEAVGRLAQFLTDGDPIRSQMMNGHAWWAQNTHDVAFFIEAQARFNTAKMLAVIEEAWQPNNTNRVFVACLTHMSPTEVISFFSELAFQLQHGQIMRLPRAHLTEPIPYPPNLLLIGTMDTSHFDWSDEALLSKTTLIQWPGGEIKRSTQPDWETIPLRETHFLDSLIRTEAAARLKLCHILGSEQPVLLPLHLVERVLIGQEIRLPGSVKGETLIYIANAWSKTGVGLFSQGTSNNFTIALDMAIVQILFPRISAKIRDNPTLRRRLQEALSEFPKAVEVLESLN